MRYLILGLLLVGCTKGPTVNDQEVVAIIQNRIDADVGWGKEPLELIEDLTVEKAIQFALLNNPKIQAFFEELGLSQANLIQAGLFSNPTFEVELRYPKNSGLKTNIEYLFLTSILDLFLIPLRTELAAIELEQTKQKIAHEILTLAFDVRQTYYEWVAENSKMKYAKDIIEIIRIERDLVSNQMIAGNVNSLTLLESEAKFLEAELEYISITAKSSQLNEALHRLLGLKNSVCLSSENIPEIEPQLEDLCILELRALEERLDLQVSKYEILRLCHMLGLKQEWVYTNLKIGLAGERDTDGTTVFGPGFSLELPLFNYGQADRMRLFAELRIAQNKRAELEIKVLSEVREAYQLICSYHAIVRIYQDSLLPKQLEIMDTSEALYNRMGMGIDHLLTNKLQEFNLLKSYTEALKNYLLAKVALDRALGGYL